MLRAAVVRGKTRLSAFKNMQPRKLLRPASPGRFCHVVLSSYGGLVAGDVIRLRVAQGSHAGQLRGGLALFFWCTWWAGPLVRVSRN